MTITTATYWDLDGIPLNTYAYNISSIGDGRTNVPTNRGGDLVIPYRRGEKYLPKIVSSRVITLGIWIGGMDEDGNPPASGNIEAQWQENFDYLRNAFCSTTSQKVLTKRFYRDGSIVAASALVEFTRGFEPQMQTAWLGRTTVTLHLADPYFYGEAVVEEFDTETAAIDVLGDTETHNILLEMGAGTAMVNQAPDPNVSIGTSVAADIDVLEKKVNGLSSPAVITTSGSDSWFALFPGSNTIVTTGGAVTMTYRPAYF